MKGIRSTGRYIIVFKHSKHYMKPRSIITLNRESLKAFAPGSGTSLESHVHYSGLNVGLEMLYRKSFDMKNKPEGYTFLNLSLFSLDNYPYSGTKGVLRDYCTLKRVS